MRDYDLYTLESGRTVRVPRDEVEKNMRLLGLTKQEAVDLWLCDNDYIVNEEEQALTAKAKENRVTATVHKAKSTEYKPKTQKERVAKADPTKEGIISAIAEMLPSVNAENIVIANKGKLITFTIGADSYKLDLIRQRPPKTEGK